MISHTLQTLTVTTLGDDTKTETKIDRGVTQGGQASPTLFKLFINTLADALQRHLWNPNSGFPAHLYADDVIIHVKSMLDLQRALIIWERWAERCGMRWALSKGKSEFLLPSELALQYKAFPFPGGQITTVTQARYFGVVFSANGILKCSFKNRIQMQHASLSTLRSAKLIFPRVAPSYARMVYRELLEVDYAIFLCPSGADAFQVHDCLLQRFFIFCLLIRVRQSQIRRLLVMFNFDALRIRWRTFVHAFAGRPISILIVGVASGINSCGPRSTSSSSVFAVSFVQVSRWCRGSRFFVMSLMSDGSRSVLSRDRRAYSFVSYKTHCWAQFVL